MLAQKLYIMVKEGTEESLHFVYIIQCLNISFTCVNY
jgi:hypothetical protein